MAPEFGSRSTRRAIDALISAFRTVAATRNNTPALRVRPVLTHC
jgi:hypothetical protein